MSQMSRTLQTASSTNGVLRVYIETLRQIDWQALKAQSGYDDAVERPPNDPRDPWCYMIADDRDIGAEVQFFDECARLTAIIQRHCAETWSAEVFYYPPAQSSCLYHWSSTLGTLHPHKTLTWSDRLQKWI